MLIIRELIFKMEKKDVEMKSEDSKKPEEKKASEEVTDVFFGKFDIYVYGGRV